MRGVTDARLSPEENIICRCFVVTEATIAKAIRDQRLHSVDDVTACTNAGGGCGSCYTELQQMVDRAWGTKRIAAPAAKTAGLTNGQKRTLILKLVHDRMQALIERNGLELHVLDVNGNRVLTRFKGSLVGTQQPSFLAIKKYFVKTMTEVCGETMEMVELNVLESRTTTIRRS